MSQSDPFAIFPPELRRSVEGLTWLGYLEDSFEFCGHRFSIRTLYGHEELLASLLTKEYTETLGQAKAWAWAHVALCLTAVDGQEDFCPPIGPDEMEYARGRFRYVTKTWFWPLAEYIFQRYADLSRRQLDAIQAVQDLSKRSLSHSSPSPDSLNVPGTSDEPTGSEDPS